MVSNCNSSVDSLRIQVSIQLCRYYSIPSLMQLSLDTEKSTERELKYEYCKFVWLLYDKTAHPNYQKY